MKTILKKIMNLIGFKISRVDKNNFFKNNQIDLILDIGAHQGEFAKECLAQGFLGKIISFEPQKKIHKNLIKNSKSIKNWYIFKRCARGRKNCKSQINITNETLSSSMLKPNNIFKEIDPNIEIIKKEKTQIFTLDYIFRKFSFIEKKIFLKIDSQGYEWEILKGAKLVLKKISFVQLELSIRPLYSNEMDYLRLLNFMKKEVLSLILLE
jgi:FkbM family methyltransferase